MKDLVNSNVARQNVLNNKYALEEMQKAIGLRGVIFEGELKFTSQDLSSFFEVSDRTIRICLEKNQQEIRNSIFQGQMNDLLIELNGYETWRKMFGQETSHDRMRDVEMILRFFALNSVNILGYDRESLNLVS